MTKRIQKDTQQIRKIAKWMRWKRPDSWDMSKVRERLLAKAESRMMGLWPELYNERLLMKALNRQTGVDKYMRVEVIASILDKMESHEVTTGTMRRADK